MMPEAEAQTASRRTLARYSELINRVLFDLKLTHDAAMAVGLPFKRLSRVKRAQREITDELREIEGKGRQ